MKRAILTILLSGSAFTTNAVAQDRAVVSPAPTREANQSAEIIVTALRREASVQSVPAAITAVGGQSLVNRAITNPEALASTVPGLQFTSAQSSTQLSIRGVSLDVATGTGEPAVAPYINGVYISRVTAPLIDFTDLSRVEVLRGPQGTLYGRNSTGGAVNLISTRPTDKFEGEITGGIGSYERRLVRGTISGPLIEGKLGFRLSGSYDYNDGSVLNVVNNRRLNGLKRTYVHGGLTFEPSSAIKNDFDVFYVKEKSETPLEFFVQQTVPGFFEANFPGLPINFISNRNDRIAIDTIPNNRRDMLLFTNNLTVNLTSDVRLKFITGYNRHNFKTTTSDGDGTDQPITLVGDKDHPVINDSRTFTQEINLSGSVGPIDFVAGLYYFNEKSTPSFPAIFPLGLPSAGVPAGSALISFSRDHTKSRAAFADVTYNVSDRLRLVGGLRYSQDRKNITQTQGIVIPGLPADAALQCNATKYKAKFSSWTPKAGVQFDVTDKILTYAQYQKGEKAGTFNLSVCGNEVDPETITSYEVGFKSRLLDNSLTLNVSAFNYDYSDLQVIVLRNVPGIAFKTFALDNAAKARIKGFEIEAEAHPSERWTVSTGISYLDAKYQQYDNGAGQDFSGNRLTRAPKWSIKSAAEYRLPLSGFFSSLSLRGEMDVTDRVYFMPSNLLELSQPSTVLINASVNLMSDEHGLSLRAFGRNLTDQDVFVNLFDSSTQGGNFGFRGARRTWGVEASKRF